jgi:hypothetical protein
VTDVTGTLYADTRSKSACGNNGYDYDQIANPPILHRKETFLHPAHPLHASFARLTRQEEKAGLLQTRGQGSGQQSVVSSQ